ncbi:MAG: hypothetical protein Ct9H90mP13_00600 [Pseudomonadota bacterium]|nr:MAG: hypothetical protein Ct9H90mP13_00600 [Pseudomonadota bacterium]
MHIKNKKENTMKPFELGDIFLGCTELLKTLMITKAMEESCNMTRISISRVFYGLKERITLLLD